MKTNCAKSFVEPCQGSTQLLRPLARAWLDETQAGPFELTVDLDHHLADLQRLVDSPEADVLLLVQSGLITGYAGLVRFPSPLGEEKIANEHYFYVLPEKRGRGSLKLMDAMFDWAREKGCSHLIANASKMASEMHDRVCRMYERKGFTLFESSYIARIDKQ